MDSSSIDTGNLNSKAQGYTDWDETFGLDLKHPHWQKILQIVKEIVRTCRRGSEHQYTLTEDEMCDLVFYVASHEFIYGSGNFNSPEQAYIRSVAWGSCLTLGLISTNNKVARSGIDWSTI
jgi:hypothetical protein